MEYDESYFVASECFHDILVLLCFWIYFVWWRSINLIWIVFALYHRDFVWMITVVIIHVYDEAESVASVYFEGCTFYLFAPLNSLWVPRDEELPDA